MEPLAVLDSLMLAGETVGSAMHVGVVLVFTPPAGADRHRYLDGLYRESLASGERLDHRLRRHPRRGPNTAGVWVWRDAGRIDLADHVSRASLPPGSGPAELWQLVSDLHGARLDLSAPLWSSCLIDGLEGGRYALYIKIHHIVVDGVGGLRMISDSLSSDPNRRGMAPFHTGRGGHRERAAPHGRLPDPLGVVRSLAGAAAAGIDLTRNVATAELANLAGALVSDTVVAPLGAPRTRFNARLGSRRAAIGADIDRKRVRRVQQAAGVTGNDVVTAVIAGAVRAWLAERDELPRRTLVAMCPVSVRSHDERGSADGGNRFGLGLCPLGTDLEHPGERLALIHDAMAGIKHQVAARGPGAMLAVMGPAIGSTVVLPLLPLGNTVPPSCNVSISSVPGPPETMYYNGSRLEGIYPVSSVYDGMALNATACSYADRICLGYVADRDVVGDIGEFAGLTEQALAELEFAVLSTP